jgi:hypothetical protein
MRLSAHTDERPGYLHPVPFVILGLCSRNNVDFGRAGDMIYHVHDEGKASLWLQPETSDSTATQ